MGAVTLNVADLDAMTSYYRDAVGLEALSADGSRVTLGRRRPDATALPIMVLEQTPALRHAGPREAGLFHTAILFDDESALAAAVYATARHPRGRFTGSADHLVSKAFYFDDPEGNGVELYWDRLRTEWSWVNGHITMGSERLDPNEYLREHLTEDGIDGPLAGAGAQVGHVHLSVGDVATAREFYVNRLGFDETVSMPTALFVSAGGYHHHMAMNVWNSLGAGRRQQTLGLGRLDIVVPGDDDLGEIGERMAHHGSRGRDDGRSLAFDDPWNNVVRITTAAAESSV
ncbi:VOC family protein [Homoserinibacter sp. GY 40078]|nr:VOC family protein [Homoserinibacter sp. GY 40078]